MSPRLRRLGLSVLAAVGSVLVFVTAAYVGVAQTDQARVQRANAVSIGGQNASPRPGNARLTPSPQASPGTGTAQPATSTAGRRILSGTVVGIDSNHVFFRAQGLVWEVTIAPKAVIKLSGKSAQASSLEIGDRAILLGQSGNNAMFLARAITARPAPATPTATPAPTSAEAPTNVAAANVAAPLYVPPPPPPPPPPVLVGPAQPAAAAEPRVTHKPEPAATAKPTQAPRPKATPKPEPRPGPAATRRAKRATPTT